MTLADLEGYQIRLIGPKQEKGMMRGYVGKTNECLGRVFEGAIDIDAPAGVYDVSFRKDLKAPWLSSPDVMEHRCP